MTIIRHTDAEVLQEIAAILWPSLDPEQQWTSDTIQEVADTLALLRPELLPWGFGCLACHGWVRNALDCAAQRDFSNRLGFVRGYIAREALDSERDTVNALTNLLYEPEDDD
jgi:hypothetical protein